MLAYKEGNSWFHRMDPLTKFAWISIIALWLLSLREAGPIIAVSIGVFWVALIGAGLNVLRYLKSVLLIMVGGSTLILYQGWFRPGPGIDVGPIHFSYDGMQFGLVLLTRTFGIVAASLAFSRTTRPKDVALSLIKLTMPYKFAHLGYLSLRFLPLFHADMQHLNDAQKLRGIKPGPKMMIRSFVALLITELRRTEETAIALEVRAFGLHKEQTQVEEITIAKSGVLLVTVTVIIMIAQVAWLIAR
jgi:energy-coupling factor transport system permease protein